MAYRYYSIYRPVFIGTYPKFEDNKIVEIFNYDTKTEIEGVPRSVWGYIDYENPISVKDALNFELWGETYKQD